MIRTQVYLADNQPKKIELMSKITKKPQSEIIRAALDLGLEALRKQRAGTASGLQALVDLGKKYNLQGPPDLSRRIDDYLYGDAD